VHPDAVEPAFLGTILQKYCVEGLNVLEGVYVVDV
jgi:hypothetical protein